MDKITILRSLTLQRLKHITHLFCYFQENLPWVVSSALDFLSVINFKHHIYICVFLYSADNCAHIIIVCECNRYIHIKKEMSPSIWRSEWFGNCNR